MHDAGRRGPRTESCAPRSGSTPASLPVATFVRNGSPAPFSPPAKSVLNGARRDATGWHGPRGARARFPLYAFPAADPSMPHLDDTPARRSLARPGARGHEVDQTGHVRNRPREGAERSRSGMGTWIHYYFGAHRGTGHAVLERREAVRKGEPLLQATGSCDKLRGRLTATVRYIVRHLIITRTHTMHNRTRMRTTVYAAALLASSLTA